MFAIKHEFNKSVVGKAVLASSTCLLQASAKETIAIETIQIALTIISDKKLPGLAVGSGDDQIKADGVVTNFSQLSKMSVVDTLDEGFQHFAESCNLFTFGQISQDGAIM